MNSRPTEDQLKQRIEDFFRAFPRGGFSAADLAPAYREQVSGRDPQKPIEASDQPGLYYYVDASGRVLNVGVATRTLGPRFWDHFGKTFDPTERDGWQLATEFQPRPLIDPNPEKLGYLAALEAFLIGTLRPPLNNRVGGAPLVRPQVDTGLPDTGGCDGA